MCAGAGPRNGQRPARGARIARLLDRWLRGPDDLPGRHTEQACTCVWPPDTGRARVETACEAGFEVAGRVRHWPWQPPRAIHRRCGRVVEINRSPHPRSCAFTRARRCCCTAVQDPAQNVARLASTAHVQQSAQGGSSGACRAACDPEIDQFEHSARAHTPFHRFRCGSGSDGCGRARSTAPTTARAQDLELTICTAIPKLSAAVSGMAECRQQRGCRG